VSTERRLDAAGGQDGHKLFSQDACALEEQLVFFKRTREFHRLFSTSPLLAFLWVLI